MHRIAQLATVIDRHVVGTGICTTAMPHVSLIRADAPSTPTPAVYEASLCLIAQGSKRVSIGEHEELLNLIERGADPLEIELAAREHKMHTVAAYQKRAANQEETS